MAPAATEREAASDELHADAALVAARLNRANSDLVELAVRLLDGDLWAGGGISSPEHWLVLRLGLSPARARDVTRLARRRSDLPVMSQAQRDGQLSLEQASVVAQYVPAGKDEPATELAVNATVPQLRRALSRFQFDEPATQEPDPHGPETVGSPAWAAKAPELSMDHRDGRFTLRFSAPSDTGALVEQALLEAKDALFRVAAGLGNDDGTEDAGGAERAPAGDDAVRVTYADALLELANRSLSSVESTSRAGKYRVYVHLSTDGSWVGGRGAIPPSIAAKFACDGVVQPVWETDGVPVSVGRAQRIAPDRTRRLVEDRDRGCRFPGCHAARHVEVHHLDHWSEGGRTDIDRMLCLCDRHHDAHHRGEFTMEGDPSRLDGLRFRNERGRELRPPSPLPPSTITPPRTHPPGTSPVSSEWGEATTTWASSAAWDDPDDADLVPYDGPTGERLFLRDVWLSDPAPMGGALPIDAEVSW